MRIFLVRTPWEKLHLGFYKIANFEPLQLEYIYTAVKDMAEVVLWDLWFEKEKRLYRNVQKYKPEILAMSICTNQIYSAVRIASKVKKLSPDTVIMAGGGSPTLTPGYFRNTCIDLLCVGNGGDTFRDLALRITAKKGIKNIEGTIEICGPELIHNPRRKLPAPIDYYGNANRELTQKYRKHYHLYHYQPLASTFFSKGCWNRCKFCVTWMGDGCGSIEKRDVDAILGDLQSIREKWIFILDDDSFAHGHQLESILIGIEQLKIDHFYMTEATSDDIIKNEKLVRKWAKLGLRKVLIGLESPFDVDLNSVGKAANTRHNIKAINLLRKYGVDVIASFIIFDHWTARQFKDLWRFVKKNKLFWVHYQAFTPLPGSKLYIEKYEQITNHNLDLFDEEHMLFKTKIPLFLWYWHRFLLQLKTNLPHRGFDKQVHRSIPLNPFHPIYRSFSKLLLEYFFTYFHHLFKAPQWQTRNLKKILSPGPVEDLIQLRPFNYLDENRQKINHLVLTQKLKTSKIGQQKG